MSELLKSIQKHEGLRLKTYLDTKGVPTIGYGTNLLHLEIPPELAQLWLRLYVEKLQVKMERKNWYIRLNQCRKDVVINMCYNLGYNGFMKFKKTIAFIEIENFKEASLEMIDSQWSDEVGNRALSLSRQMQSGNYE